MRDDEKIFNIGVAAIIIVVIMMAIVQVANRQQERQRRSVRAEIVRTQQEFAARTSQVATLTRPENLRGIVSGMFPNFQTIGFTRNINANDIPLRAE